MSWRGETPPDGGAQWLEGRGFARLYGLNPEAQERAMKFLLGLLKFRTEQEISRPDNQRVVEALQVVIKDFVRVYPEFLEANVSLSGLDLGGGTYDADPLLVQEVTRLIDEPDKVESGDI